MKHLVRTTLLSIFTVIMAPLFAQDSGEDEAQIYASLRSQMERACPAIWEDLGANMDTTTLNGEVWAANDAGVADRAEFVSLMQEIMSSSTAEEIAAMADDLATVATECASHRVALLDALISKTPQDVLLAMDAVNKGLNKSIEYLDGGWSVGDVRVTGRLQPQDGWVFMIGQTIGKTSGDLIGEDYNELFELAKNWAPNSGNEDWNSGHLVTLPDMRGRALVAADNMGGASANRVAESGADKIGGTFGAETRALTSSQLPTHNHTLSGNGSHSHTVGTDTHSHKIRSSVFTGSSGAQSTYPYFEGRARPNYQNTIQSSVLSDSHNHSLSSTGHSHTINNTGSSAPVKMTQPSIVFNVEMKY